MKIKLFVMLVIIIGVVVAATPFLTVHSSDFTKINGDLKTAVEDNNAFATDLYQELKSNNGNLFFSPYSISTALAMTYAGARGQTEREMAKVLHFPLEQELLHSSYSELQSILNSIQDSGDVKLSIANSLWIQKSYRFLDSFLNLNKKYYGARLNFVDFANENEVTRKTINNWVEDKTQQKIKELIKPGMLDSLTRLVLCNAIYFKGSWAYRFDKKRTVDAKFYLSSDRSIQVPMMSQDSKFRFNDFGNFSGIELPYKGNDLSMIVFLPKEIDGLADFEKNLTSHNVKKWADKISNMSISSSKIHVELPRFKMVCEFELRDTLSKMGMPHAFVGADFSGMTKNKELYISNVIHKAFVEVKEEGTEAAAATAVVSKELGITSFTPIFNANHPFIFLIRENIKGSILFIGRVIDPAA